MKAKKTVVVGMSGGVDSSVAALLLKEQGYNVIGLFMKNWEEANEAGICKASIEYGDVVKVCAQIDMPCYSVNFCEEYRERVFQEFLTDLKAGKTPNPDVLCNREIKFNVFLKKALEFGADYLATGHYCQIDESAHLLKGADPNKDQSYFLYAVAQEAFKKVLFPIGHLPKGEVREIARKHNLATSQKKDSTGICFIGKRNFKEFVSQYIGYTPGDLKTLGGKTVGKHDGSAFYTLGQRKGLGLGGEGDAWFVVAKDHQRNIVFVERGEKHPALFTDDLTATDLTWIGEPPSSFPTKCTAKVRYRQSDQACTITNLENGGLKVVFDEPQRAVTPGQAIVFYDQNRCLGGGKIESIGPTYFRMGKPLPS